jgi:N-methylhydantoinase B
MVFSGVDPRTGTYYSYLETLGGGFGARATKDGLDGVQTHVTNTSNLPVESLEQEYPLLVERYELIPDSGGQGQFRGGMGIRRDIRVLEHQAVFGGSTSRRLSAPWGLGGGSAGGRAQILVDTGHGWQQTSGVELLNPGDRVSVRTAGSGGYGDPRNRAREAIERDVDDGVVTLSEDREVYGFGGK